MNRRSTNLKHDLFLPTAPECICSASNDFFMSQPMTFARFPSRKEPLMLSDSAHTAPHLAYETISGARGEKRKSIPTAGNS